jgi:predicted DNA-binding transcriptional regulator YafY
MAIYQNKQLSFQYCEWTPKKELRLKHEGERYVVSPWALTWDHENYYLIAYDENADKIKHYRVDKMKNLIVQKEARNGEVNYQAFNLADFTKKTFSMFGGRDEEVTFIGKNNLAGVVLDRFGSDIWMRPLDEEHFKARVEVTVSSQFFGWLTGLGGLIKIEGPEHIKAEYQSYLQNILNQYKK